MLNQDPKLSWQEPEFKELDAEIKKIRGMTNEAEIKNSLKANLKKEIALKNLLDPLMPISSLKMYTKINRSYSSKKPIIYSPKELEGLSKDTKSTAKDLVCIFMVREIIKILREKLQSLYVLTRKEISPPTNVLPVETKFDRPPPRKANAPRPKPYERPAPSHRQIINGRVFNPVPTRSDSKQTLQKLSFDKESPMEALLKAVEEQREIIALEQQLYASRAPR